MSDEIGKLVVNVGLDSTGFQNGITNINRQMRVVQSEFQAAAAKLGDFGSSTEALGLKADSLTKQIELQRQKVQALNAAFQQSAEAKGNDAKATQDLQIKLNKAQAQLSTMENELNKTTSQIKEQEAAVKSQSGVWSELANSFTKSESDIRSGLSRITDTIKTTLVFGTVYKGLGMIKDGFDAVIGGGIKFDSTMQQNQIAFTTMLGSAQKAKDLMTQLSNMAAVTPFETADLTQASRTLLAFGVSANQIMPTLKMLGDVSQGDKQRFDSLTLAFAQIQSAGKMQGQDLLQLVSAGFNPLQVISQKTGKSMAELRDEMAKGAISAQMVTKAFQDATSKGGMFYNAMQNQSTTYSGLISTLKDNLNTTFGQVMKPVFDWLTNTALPKAIDMTTKFTDTLQKAGMIQALKTIIPPSVVNDMVTFGNIVKDTFNFIKQNGAEIAKDMLAIGAAIVTFKTLNTAVSIFEAIKKATQEVTIAQLALNAVMDINPFVAIGTAVVAVGVLIYTHWGQIKSFLIESWNAIKSIAQTVWNGITSFFQKWGVDLLAGFLPVIGIPLLIAQHWGQITAIADQIWTGLVTWIKDLWNEFTSWISAAAKAAMKFIVDAFEWMYNHNYYFKQLVDLIKSAWNTIKTDAAAIWGAIKSFFTQLWSDISTIASTAWRTFTTVLSGIWNGLISMLHNIWNPIGNFFSGLWNGIKNVASALWNSISGTVSAGALGSYKGITGVFDQLGGYFANLWKQAEDWGANLIHMMAQGITNAAHEVLDAAKNVASKIAGFLGFHSPTEEGPASDSDTWAPNFMKMFAQGIRQNIPTLQRSLNAAALSLNPTIKGQHRIRQPVDSLNSLSGTSSVPIASNQPINIYMDSELIGSYVWNAATGQLQQAQRKGV